ncbi:hypothetical protein ASPWEDRAFT_40357 [Aspergillus wentii DTO 134E9]|uniref:Copper-fist domain-containing protein n=1 Tax=Aspergillus wentii DTO 134E9 TaxID=1073089 RepID=A0A1L9RJU4_ASPWE|nr:uncharacterized protein ASPWEDRAFT_40357 [Aspergillus wentii DTO 134E9]KAI9923842.1 hypothetical protein MW887_008324 [Aspergillus wentii]OJJ35173.1 hypothetical protein ASPWEDRAFT_40357 [Aspergillus wentii DTO 134E9]
MPLDEEGAKWSCEPCIRGHRSSKCQHFDRLMMKVPKAGRPLAKCPHPKGTCSCQKLYAFMIRIPKGPTCLCRPVYQLPADGDETGQPTIPTPPASIPPMASPVPGKVQKSGRRQSNLQAAPENIVKALDSVSQFEAPQIQNGISNNLSSYPAHTPAFNNSYGPLNLGFNGNMTQHSFDQVESSTQQKGSCCSSKSEPPKPVQAKGPCCGKSDSPADNSPSGETGIEESKGSHVAPLHGMPYPPFSTPQVSTWQDFNVPGQGQYMQPFVMHQPQAQLPAYLPEYMSSNATPTPMGYPHQSISQDIFAQPPLSSLPENAPQNFTFTPPPTFDSDSTHECRCGDGCQCLGCASHPYNNTTRQHVQEMGLLVTLDDGKQSPDKMNGHQNHFPASTNGTPLAYSFPHFGHQLNDDIQANAMHSYPEQTAYPHNGYSSPTDYAQQLMEPSEYYTLEYPVGLPNACSDMSGSCQCGNDCSCIGCLTHSGHNGVPLEPPVTTAEDAVHQATQEPWSSSIPAGVDSSRIPVLDNLSVPASSPQAIDP